MARYIIPETKAPEIGTREAALEGCVDLIARMCGKPPVIVRYWLDAYFQLRLAYAVEEEQRRREESQAYIKKGMKKLRLALRPVIEEAQNTERKAPAPEDQVDEAPAAETKEEQKPVAERSVTPPPAGSGELAGFEPVEPVTRRRQGAPKGNARAADALTFKRETFNRLLRMREDGVTIAQIVSASNGKLQDGIILDILAAKPVPIAEYRKLAAALDKIEKEAITRT